MCFGIVGLIGGCFAMCGIAKCCRACGRCRVRDCSCIKWWMRKTGTDTFDDFEALILVHEVQILTRGKKFSMFVRVTAGDHKVETEESKGVFQQPLAIFVEQGTPSVKVECINCRSKQVISSLKLDAVQDILRSRKTHAPCEVFAMKQKHKDVMNPKITLTIKKDYQKELEKGAMLVQGMGVSKETGVLLQHQADQTDGSTTCTEGGVSSEVDLLMRGSSGPLLMFGSWGSTTKVYVAVQYKSDTRRFHFGVWKDRQEFDKGNPPKLDIDLMKVFSVQPDPNRKEVFVIEYAPAEKERKRVMMQRLDLTRDAWVEILQLLIKTIRNHREDNRKKLKTTTALPPGGMSFDNHIRAPSEQPGSTT